MDGIEGICRKCGHRIENLVESLRISEDVETILWCCPECETQNETPVPVE